MNSQALSEKRLQSLEIIEFPSLKKIGVDLDGVLCLNMNPRKLFRPHRMHEYYSLGQYTGFAKDIPVVIITARKETFRRTTEEWLHKNDIVYSALIMMQIGIKKNFENCVKLKAKFINELDLDIYYEDDPNILKKLRKLCPKTEIVDVA